MSENKREGVRKVPRKRREIMKLVERERKRERSRKEREREMLNETLHTRENKDKCRGKLFAGKIIMKMRKLPTQLF